MNGSQNPYLWLKGKLPKYPAPILPLTTMAKFKFLLWLAFTLGGTSAVAQSAAPAYTRFTTEQGLADNWVHTALQDRFGFLWLGCEGGLSRFDGQQFLNFYSDKNNPHSLANNTVRGICEDPDGTLWLAVLDGGLHNFDPRTGKFESWKKDPKKPDFKGELTSILQDGDLLWLGTYHHGLGCFDKKKRQYVGWYSYPADEHSKDTWQFNTVNHLIADRRDPNHIWVAAANRGLARFDKQSRRFEVWPIAGVSGRTGVSAMQLVQDRTGHIWIGTWSNGIVSFDPATGRMEAFPYDQASYLQANNYNRNVVLSLAEKSDTELWVATEDNGLGIFDKATGSYSFLKNEFNGESPELDRVCQGLYVDPQQRLWALGRQGGIRVFAPQQHSLRYISLAKGRGGVAERAEVTDFAFSPGRRTVFVATENNGCFEWSEEQGALAQRALALPDGSFPNFKTLLCDAKGNIWAGTAKTLGGGASLYRLRLGQSSFEAALLRFQPPRGLEETVNDLLEDAAGNVWATTSYDGFYKIDPSNLAVETYREQGNFAKGAPSFNKWWVLLDMALAPNGHIWFALKSGGILDFDPATRNFRMFNTDTGLPSNDLQCIETTADGQVWVGSKRDGLIPLNATNAMVGTSMTDGLPSLSISAIRFDSASGSLWLATDKGLCSFDSKGNRTTVFGTSSGLRNTYLNGKGLEIVEGIGLLLGQPNGFCILKNTVATVPETTAQPRVAITDIKVFNQSKYFEKKLRIATEVALTPDEDVFSFEFAMPASPNADIATYQYRLDGFDEDWYNSEDGHTITYSSLQPGTYTLRVKGFLPGQGVSAETSVLIRILPHWWQTWWARAAAALLVGLLLLWGYKARTRQLKRENELLRQMNDLERSALQAQMSPHFIFNCLGAIQNFILQNEKEQAMEYLGQFAQLVRGVLNASVEGKVTLREEVQLLENYLSLERLRFDQRFDYSVSGLKGAEPPNLAIPPLLIQPYVENAVLHGMAGKKSGGLVEVIFQHQSNGIDVIIRDNGGGFNASYKPKNHKSVGMTITRSRLELLNNSGGDTVNVKTITDATGHEIGTEVIIRIGYIAQA